LVGFTFDEVIKRGIEGLTQLPGIGPKKAEAIFKFAQDYQQQAAEAAPAIPALRHYMEERGLRVGRLEAIEPTLEDVFVSLTSGRAEPGPGGN